MTLFDDEFQAPDPGSARAAPRLIGRVPAVWLLLASGLLLRLVIGYLIAPGQGLSIDLKNFDDWARTLADHGPGGFYQSAQFAGYPPGYLYFLWPIGIIGRALAPIFGATEYDTVFALLKLPAILADIAIGYLLYRTARRWFGESAGLMAAALYLFVPATWYESALWGQVDSVGMLFLLGGLLLLIEGWSEWSVAMLLFAIVIKPQYAVGILVAAPILLRRHLLVRGSGPVPYARGWMDRLDARLDGLFTRRQGFERLATCALVGLVTMVLVLWPWDIWIYAPASVSGIPGIGHIAGFLGLLSARAGDYPVLTANAFNAWALVGPIPLYSELSRTFIWAYDSLTVIGPLQAVTLGAALLAVVGGLVVAVLLLRDGRATILGSATVLAFAIFALPTRVHERYQFPVFVTFALLIAGTALWQRRWRWWYLLVGLLAAVNLHAIATLSQPSFASPGLVGAPLGDLFRSDAVVIAASVGNTLLFGILLVAWLRGAAVPAFRSALARWAGPARVDADSSAAVVARVRELVARKEAGERQASEDRQAAAAAGASAEPPASKARRAKRAKRAPVAQPVAVAGGAARLRGALVAMLKPFRLRLGAGPSSPDRTGELVGEGGGRIDRRDLLIMLAILVVTFAVRVYRIDQPRHMYFDELYYASTATEFLQDWRYGIKTEIFEYTHPHMSKYAQAMSLATFGNDRVTDTGRVGAPVRDAAFEPALYDAASGRYDGDLVAVATGTALRLAPHGDWALAVDVVLPGAARVAFDRATQRLYATSDDGSLWAVEGSALAGVGAGGAAPAASRIGTERVQAGQLLVIAPDRVLVVGADGDLTLIDGSDGQVLGTKAEPGLTGVVPITVGGQPQVVVAVPDGLVRLDGASLEELSRTGLAAAPAGLDLVDGSDFGWRNQDTLPIPTLYVALANRQLEAVQVAADGRLTPFDIFAMPGSVSEVRWDRPTNMVHVLGQTAAGKPTIYVVEPHTNSVFADAELPFAPVAWLVDAQPDTPSLDRQHALAFSANGDIAYVDTGSHAWAWRLPGLVAGVLTAALMYLLARMLFRRRTVAVLLAALMAVDALFFIQGRIAMNDSLLGFFIVYALTLLVALLESRPGRIGRWLIPLFGLPAVGVLLGLALSTKWVGAYAIGGALLLVLARTRTGRWLALGGLVLITGVLGFQALAGEPPNFVFWLLMVGLTAGVGVIMVGLRTRDRMSGSGFLVPGWVDPRRAYGLPFAYAVACLVVVPLGVYVASYIPWAVSVVGDPQLFPGWPVGHHGQTFLDLQSQMYHYHNDLRTPHAAGSPWWAWPLALKPVWGYYDTFSNGTQGLMLITANPFLVWLGVPASVFAGWQAWRRQSTGLAIVLIAMLSLWLPWARIDRVAFNYHWYTILPFFYLLLAYFLAELWNGPSRRTWTLARISFAVVLILPALMWILKDPLCTIAGVGYVAPSSFQCSRSIADVALPVVLWLVGGLVAGWFVLGMSTPRRLVLAVLGLGAAAFVALYPAISGLPIPNGWPPIFQGLLPTWDISFQFNFNTLPVTTVPLLGIGPLVLTLAAAGMTWWMMRASVRRIPGDYDAIPAEGEAPDGDPAAPAGKVEPEPIAAAVEVPPPLQPAEADAVAEADAAPQEPAGSAQERERAPSVPAGRWRPDDRQIDRWFVPVGLFVLAALVYGLVNHGRPATLNYFVPLADAFLHGQLGLSAAFSWLGEVVYGPNGLYNVVFPPAPAMLLMPFVTVFGTGFPQQLASILLGAANLAIMSLILARMGLDRQMRVILSLVFGFGTIVWYSAQVGTGWHFAHVISLFFILLAILGCQRDARTWVIGLLFAGAVLSRLSMLAAAPFFLAYVADRTWRGGSDDTTPFGMVGRIAVVAAGQLVERGRYLRLIWPMGVSLAVPLVLYLLYNAARFGSPLENGYALVPGLADDPAFANGLVSLSAIPGNLYALLLAPPSIAPAFPYLLPPLLGSMSLILTTPLLLWAFRARERDWFTMGAWASIGLLLVPTLLRADPGGVQFGFRYAQDMLPFLFLLAVHGLRGRPDRLAWVAIGIGVAVNLWGMAYAFNGWWP